MATQNRLFSCFFFFFFFFFLLLLLIIAVAAPKEEDGDGSSNNNNTKKGPWSPDEDAQLLSIVNRDGPDHWDSVAKNCGLNRSGKSCRLRYRNHLQPGLKKERITIQEAADIERLHQSHGNKWAVIAQNMPGRTDNEIKNFWNTRMQRLNRKRNASNLDADEVIGHPNATIINNSVFSHSSSPFANGTASYSNEHESGSSEFGRHIDSGFSSACIFTNRSAPQIQQNSIGYQHQHYYGTTHSMPIQEDNSSRPSYANELHMRGKMVANTHDPHQLQNSEVIEDTHIESGFPSKLVRHINAVINGSFPGSSQQILQPGPSTTCPTSVQEASSAPFRDPFSVSQHVDPFSSSHFNNAGEHFRKSNR